MEGFQGSQACSVPAVSEMITLWVGRESGGEYHGTPWEDEQGRARGSRPGSAHTRHHHPSSVDGASSLSPAKPAAGGDGFVVFKRITLRFNLPSSLLFPYYPKVTFNINPLSLCSPGGCCFEPKCRGTNRTEQ